MEFCKKGLETQSGIEHYGREQTREECGLKRDRAFQIGDTTDLVSALWPIWIALYFLVSSKYSWEMGEERFKNPLWKGDSVVFRWSRKASLGWHRSEETAWHCTITMLYTDSDRAQWLKVLDTRQRLASKIPCLNFSSSPIHCTHTPSSAVSVPTSLTKYPAKWLEWLEAVAAWSRSQMNPSRCGM